MHGLRPCKSNGTVCYRQSLFLLGGTNFDYSVDLFKAEVSTSVGRNGINYSAGAYVVDGSVAFEIFGCKISVGGNIGISPAED